jgi:ferredoxin
VFVGRDARPSELPIRPEHGGPPIFTADPAVTLTLIVGALCLAVAGWKLRQKELANARSDGQRGPSGRRPDGRPNDDRTRAWDVAPRGRGNSRDRDDRDDRDRGTRDDRGGSAPRRALTAVPTGAIAPAKSSGGKVKKSAEVQVNPGKCMRFGFCEHEAPKIFKLHGDGRLGYKTTAPPDQIDAVDRAVKICPARAIKMYRPGSSMYLPQNSPDLIEPRLDDDYEEYDDEFDEMDDLDDEFDDYEDDIEEYEDDRRPRERERVGGGRRRRND